MDKRSVVIVGDGPTGLSAALLLAKTDFDVTVLGSDQTPMHRAVLYNYLGFDGKPGPEFMSDARRHAELYGAKLIKTHVDRVELGETPRAHTAHGVHDAHYLILTTGWSPAMADLALERRPDGTIKVDTDGRTSVDRVYSGGSATRGKKSHVATSVGDGAAIATDIMSREAGKPTHDYDVLRSKPT